MSSVVNMSALALNQLLESSQDKGIELELETSALENQSVLEAVEKMSLDAMPKGGRRAVNLVWPLGCSSIFERLLLLLLLSLLSSSYIDFL